MTILIAGGGIGGLALGLTLYQIGVPFKIFEASREIKPLGVGINIQPNAVRELEALGLKEHLPGIGVATREYGMYTKYGLEIWAEPRGLLAGYKWPQYSVHRGRLQVLLYETLIERAGADCIETGWRVEGFSEEGAPTLHLKSAHDETVRSEQGSLIIAADGIHSAIRAQMYPDEGPPIWGGAVLWRGTSRCKPFRGGASMALIGHATQRVVAYPLSEADPETGEVEMNWIAELTYDPADGWNKEDWNRKANLDDFLPQFEDWSYDWFDFPSAAAGAEAVYEYPMVDRDPLPAWTQGHVTLLGDAAHATYPVGSNGAAQAIIDSRKLGRALVDHGISKDALMAYEAEMRPATTKVVLANRGSGPDAVLQMIEDRCGGRFENLEDVATRQELADHAEAYKKIAGTSIDALNAAPPIIPEGARVAL